MKKNILLIFSLALMVSVPFLATDNSARGPLSGIRVYKDLFYAGTKNPMQNLDLYVPVERKGPPLALIVWIHGGGWAGGNKDEPPITGFVDEGYAVASLNYRLTNEAHYPDIFYDCKAAIRWLRAHAQEYGLDAGRVGVWGYSAGAHMALLLATTSDTKDLEGDEGNAEQSSAVQAVVAWAGAGDLMVIHEHIRKLKELGIKSKLDIDSANAPLTRFLGGRVEDKMELAKQASPITYATKGDPPVLIVHGEKDDVVPVAQAKELYKVFKDAGIDVKFHCVKGMRHWLFHKSNLKEVKEFFDAKLKKQ